MGEIDTSLFLVFNASPTSPAWVPALARTLSSELPKAVFAGMLGAAFFMNARQRQDLLAVLITLLVAWIASRLVKHAIPLERPFALGIGTVWLDRAPSAGFPSTHASIAFAFAVGVGLRTRVVPIAGTALALACLVAWSRLCLGLHFPSQVLAGAVLGGVSAWGVHAAQQALRRHTRRIPLPAPRGRQLNPRSATTPGRS